MKPTEADIQAELIEGWWIDESYEGSTFYYHIKKDKLKVLNFKLYDEIWFNLQREDIVRIEWQDFLTGNYDLSAISQHYDPEEWQRIITMCERIVRLITGEQVEQSLEEKVREILEPAADISELKVTDHSVEFLDYSKPPMWYFVTSSEISYVPQDAPKSRNTFTIREYRNNYGETPEINAALPKFAALLTAQPESEQTLEEAVRGIFNGDRDLEIEVIGKSEVRVGFTGRTDVITSDGIRDGSPRDFYCVDELEDSPFAEDYVEQIEQVCRLLVPKSEDTEISTRSTKPSYSELEQRVEELEKDNKRLAGDYDEVYDECEEAKKRHREARKLMERYQEDALKAKQKYDNLLTDYQRECEALENMRERLEKSEAENASLLDKFGPIDQAEQQVAEVETRFQKLAKKAERIADLLIQLNEEIL